MCFQSEGNAQKEALFHGVKLMAYEGLIAVNLKLEQYLFYLRNKTVVSCS